MTLRIATCQFPTSADVDENARHVAELLREAGDGRAHVAHFPEACLSGYAGADLPDLSGMDWELLRARTEELFALAGKLGVGMVLGSTHPLTPPHKPQQLALRRRRDRAARRPLRQAVLRGRRGLDDRGPGALHPRRPHLHVRGRGAPLRRADLPRLPLPRARGATTCGGGSGCCSTPTTRRRRARALRRDADRDRARAPRG